MVSPENNTNWIYEYGLIEDISITDANLTNFNVSASGFNWPIQTTFNASSSNPRYLLFSCLMNLFSELVVFCFQKLCLLIKFRFLLFDVWCGVDRSEEKVYKFGGNGGRMYIHYIS